MSSLKFAYTALAVIIVLSSVSFFWDAPVAFFERLIGENVFIGALVFVAVLFAATVIAPLTTLPLVPLMAPVLGPFLTALLSIIGWTLGAIVAFLIARHAGRPILSKFISLATLGKYEEYIPPHARFVTIFVLRMLVPVDVLSYALGLFSNVPLMEYTLATLFGVSWFAFAFSYLGDAAFEHNYLLFAILGGASLMVLGLSSWYVIQQVRKGRGKE